MELITSVKNFVILELQVSSNNRNNDGDTIIYWVPLCPKYAAWC